jgi:hypothetical protein
MSINKIEFTTQINGQAVGCKKQAKEFRVMKLVLRVRRKGNGKVVRGLCSEGQGK